MLVSTRGHRDTWKIKAFNHQEVGIISTRRRADTRIPGPCREQLLGRMERLAGNWELSHHGITGVMVAG